MSFLLFAAVAVAGGLGAALRFLVDGGIRAAFPVGYPLGTNVINVSGSLVLGFVTALAAGAVLPPMWAAIIGTGLLGGYTTFSTASLETVRLLQERRYVASLLNGVGMLVASVAAAAVGLLLGSLVST